MTSNLTSAMVEKLGAEAVASARAAHISEADIYAYVHGYLALAERALSDEAVERATQRLATDCPGLPEKATYMQRKSNNDHWSDLEEVRFDARANILAALGLGDVA